MNLVLRAVLAQRVAPLRLMPHHVNGKSVLFFHQGTNLRSGNIVNTDVHDGVMVCEKEKGDSHSSSTDIASTKISELRQHNIPYTDICAIQPTLSLIHHVNTSEVLSELVKLGVSIHKIDKTPSVRDWVMKLNMEENIKPLIRFFMDQEIHLDCVGDLINKCPHILQLSQLQTVRFIAYMQSKNFTAEMIKKILMKSPHLLLKSIDKMDYHLGMLQKTFDLTGKELRLIVTREPKLVSLQKQQLEERNFSFQEEMGFDKFQLKQLVVTKPRLWLLNSSALANRFDYIHNVMGLSHEVIVEFPAVLTCREFRLRARHQFLQFLGRAQYDPTVPRYVSPLQIIRDSNVAFSVTVAGSDFATFNNFCKTL